MRLPKLGHPSHWPETIEPPPVDDSYTALFHRAVETAKAKLRLLKPLQRQIVIGTATVVGLAVVYQVGVQVQTLRQRRRRRQLLRQCEEDGELHVFVLPRSPWSPSLSPACTRVEAYLRANGIPYKAVETIDSTGAPSGELPFLVYKTHRVDQLTRIFEFLTVEFTVTMDDALTREERAIGAALRRTLEYSMERFLYRTVFIDHPTLAITQIARVLHVSHLRARLAVRRYAKQLHERLAITAYGALVSEQYENEFLLDCEALEAQIGEKRFLFSNTELTSYDCAVYSLLVPFAYMGRYTSLSTAYMAVADSTVLMNYIARISKRLFADMASQFDAANASFTTSPTSSSSLLEDGEAGEFDTDSDEVHRDVEVSDEETKAAAATAVEETPSAPPPDPQAASASQPEPAQQVRPEATKSVPAVAVAAKKNNKSPPALSKAKETPSKSPLKKPKASEASPKKP